ncbi:MAG TPA: glycosyl hydrolase family 28-related protein, partial [Pyrinomonadaceae bacterium]|nr:glycosyl hydrolase family 28-related protein [Pyrinomonadaceae bacterium]
MSGKLSRRKLIAQMSVPPIAASLGASVFGARTVTAQSGASSTEDKLSGARVFNVRDFGAKGDGSTLDTVAVQSTIDAAHKNQGGIVLVPAGTFVVGTIELKSNVILHLAAQGRLLGSEKAEHYRAGNGIPPSNGNVVMISAANAENITIDGP